MLTPVWMTRPCRANSLRASFATASSAAPRNAGSASSTVTAAPRRRHTLPISRPMTPAPTTPRRAGTSRSASAPALSRIRSLSMATPGSARGFEPVATITCCATTVAAVAPSTRTCQPVAASPPANEPTPWKNATLFFLNRYRMPSLFCATTRSLRASMRRRRSRGRRPLCRARRIHGPRARNSRRIAAAPSTGCNRRWCRCRPAPACRRRASSRRCTPSSSPAARSGWPRCSRPGRRR